MLPGMKVSMRNSIRALPQFPFLEWTLLSLHQEPRFPTWHRAAYSPWGVVTEAVILITEAHLPLPRESGASLAPMRTLPNWHHPVNTAVPPQLPWWTPAPGTAARRCSCSCPWCLLAWQCFWSTSLRGMCYNQICYVIWLDFYDTYPEYAALWRQKVQCSLSRAGEKKNRNHDWVWISCKWW